MTIKKNAWKMLLMLVALWLSVLPSRGQVRITRAGDSPGPNKPAVLPVQNYAAIDISGSLALPAPVNMMALDEAGNAAFVTEGISDIAKDVGHFYTGTFQNGTSTALPGLLVGYYPRGVAKYHFPNPMNLSVHGDLMGQQEVWERYPGQPDQPPDQPDTLIYNPTREGRFSALGSSITDDGIPPPFSYKDKHDPYPGPGAGPYYPPSARSLGAVGVYAFVEGANIARYFFNQLNGHEVPSGDFCMSTGSEGATYFGASLPADSEETKGYKFIRQDLPTNWGGPGGRNPEINEKGHFVSLETWWNGKTLQAPGFPSADPDTYFCWCLTNNDRMFGSNYTYFTNTPVNAQAGLWDGSTGSGVFKPFADLLAGSPYAGQLTNITPLVMSNEDPATGEYFMVTAAQDQGDSNKDKLILWKWTLPPKLANGTQPPKHWTLSEIRLPDGVNLHWGYIEVINSSGVIAAISDGGQALLFLPTFVEENAADSEATAPATNSNAAAQPNSNVSAVVFKDGKAVRYVRFGLWDHAFAGVENDPTTVRDDFIDNDTRSFNFGILGKLPGVNSSTSAPKVHWYTDSDDGGGHAQNTITLQLNSTGNGYATPALMLVADEFDKISVQSGLPGGAKVKSKQPEYRIRQAKLGDKVHFELELPGGGATPVPLQLPIFNVPRDAAHPLDANAPDKVKKLSVHIVMARNVDKNGNGFITNDMVAFTKQSIILLKKRYAAAGIEVTVQDENNLPVLDVPHVGIGKPNAVELTEVKTADNFGPSPDEESLIVLLKQKYKAAYNPANEPYYIFVDSFDKNSRRGESFPEALNSVRSEYINCGFIARPFMNSSLVTLPHEIGHLLLNRTKDDVKDLPDGTIDTHYRGNDPKENLMVYDGTTFNQTPTDSKRLWEDADHYDGYHSGSVNQPHPPFQLGYLRGSHLVH